MYRGKASACAWRRAWKDYLVLRMPFWSLRSHVSFCEYFSIVGTVWRTERMRLLEVGRARDSRGYTERFALFWAPEGTEAMEQWDWPWVWEKSCFWALTRWTGSPAKHHKVSLKQGGVIQVLEWRMWEKASGLSPQPDVRTSVRRGARNALELC